MGVKFNEKQEEALANDVINKNVLISAGAGSGKTAVLTEKVYSLITKYNVNIDELLVLTFTDAASFGMKEKIIKRTKVDNSELANKLYSAHIQTFDSFTSFLVKKYADRLNINPNFKIIDSAIITSKKEEYIDEILKKHYEAKDVNAINTLKALCFKDDKNLKELIRNLDTFLNSLSSKDYNEFITNYDKYLSKDYIYSKYNDVLNEIYENAIQKGNYFALINEEDNEDAIEGFNQTLNVLNNIKETYLSGINNFYIYLSNFELPFKRITNKYKKMSIKTKLAFDDFMNYLKENHDIFIKYPSPSEEVERFDRLKDVHYFALSIYKELKEKIDNYKYVSSSYTFQDISLIALKLINDDKYKDIRDEIKNTFKYCLVDEYQDTNDIQEEFLNFINENSKLFVVGDIKQSIYKFRNANPSLFASRKEKYNEDILNNKVIDMNINYRSLKKVLDYSNIFFEHNMSKEKGDVEFNYSEMLIYDEKANLYDENQLLKENDYGLNVLSGYLMQKDANFNLAREEILIVINDILDKINNKYQVLDHKEGDKLIFRDCNFGDFAILCKRKTNFGLYKDYFAKYNIPLNIVFDENVRDINSIITLESLLSFYLDIKNNEKDKKLKFDYVSLARSYLFEFSDEYIFNSLNNKTLFAQDPLVNKMKSFVFNNKNKSISEVFNALINEFGLLDKLNKIGEIDNNLNKIEYVYTLIKSLEDSGKTIEEFVALLQSLNAHQIELKGNNLVKNERSVELTTIHASKGLEYKIVYLSCYDSNFKYKGEKSRNFVTKEYGMLLDDHSRGNYKDSFFKKMYLTKDEKDEYSEYIRLIYVALTRAKENLYFVNPFLYNSKNESELSKLIRNAFELKIKFNEKLFDDINVLINSSSLKSDLVDLINYYNALNSFNYLTSIENQRIIKNFSFETFMESLNESLVKKTIIGLFKDNLGDDFKKSTLKKLDEESVNQSNIDSRRSFTKSLLNKITSRIAGFYILKKFDDNEYKNEFLNNQLIDEEYRGYFKLKLKNVLESSRIKFNEEDLLLFLGLTKNKIYNPLFEFYFNDSNIKIKNLSWDKKIVPFESFKIELPNLELSQEEIVFKEKKILKASHDVSDLDIFKSNILKEGVKLHKLLELTDFVKKDTSFIKDKKDIEKIDKVLNLDVFKDLSNSKIFKEYEYLEDDQKGIIDLLIIKDNEALIIDYKTKNIDENKYKDQLDTYKRNVERIFKISNIKTYLISINDGSIKEIY